MKNSVKITNFTEMNTTSKFLKTKLLKTSKIKYRIAKNSFVQKLLGFRGYVKFNGVEK